MYVFFASKILKTLQLINKIKAWIVTNHNYQNCISFLELVLQSGHLQESQNLTFPIILYPRIQRRYKTSRAGTADDIRRLFRRWQILLIKTIISCCQTLNCIICSIHNALELLTDHSLIKLHSAVFYSVRKLRHKIRISRFSTDCSLKHRCKARSTK